MLKIHQTKTVLNVRRSNELTASILTPPPGVQELEGELSKSETLIADLKAVNERIMNQLAQQE